MRKKAQNSNKQFLIGTAAMAFAVFAVVFIFISISMDKLTAMKEGEKASADTFRIELAKGFAGDSAIIYLNDSLLWDGMVESDTFALCVNRFAEENTLMLSRTREDAVSILPISAKRARLVLRKERGVVSMITVEE